MKSGTATGIPTFYKRSFFNLRRLLPILLPILGTAIVGCGDALPDRSHPTSISVDNDFIMKPFEKCGNGFLDPDELCEISISVGDGTCPTHCDDQNPSTRDTLVGEGCNVRCEFLPLDANPCKNDEKDKECPPECNALTDADCSPECGNGLLEPGELCDTAIPQEQNGACPLSCGDGVVCTNEIIAGTDCQSQCVNESITKCDATDSDGCCPEGCNDSTDLDCPSSCGNGSVESDETCDIAIPQGMPGACMTSCDDQDSCTMDSSLGSECNLECAHQTILECYDDDGCCPSTCNSTTDSDCSPQCGDGIWNSDEKCDTAIPQGEPGSCPVSCDDKIACTLNTQKGTHCELECITEKLTTCDDDDGCCPDDCNSLNDADCETECGNGIVENGEKCDGVEFQDKTCQSMNNLYQGGSLFCVDCQTISFAYCIEAPSPSPPLCGNSIIDSGETCDIGVPTGETGSCPQECNDDNSCTTDFIVGQYCTTKCQHDPVTACKDNDECCPMNCDIFSDSDCEPVCGNGLIENGETCDTENFDGKTCESESYIYGGGKLTCMDCTSLDYSKCTPKILAAKPICGNGKLEKGEKCDGDAFGTISCETEGYSSGSLSCVNCQSISFRNCSS